MKVITLVKFKDLEANKVREVGEEFEINMERFKKLNLNTFGPLVREINKDKNIKSKGARINE